MLSSLVGYNVIYFLYYLEWFIFGLYGRNFEIFFEYFENYVN